jgi:hypothetical protein
MLASGLIAGGMNWWQAVGTILLGNLIVLMPMLLNAHAGTKYGIPFPVFVRASFGVRRQPSPRCCALWSPAAGSAFKRGSAARPIANRPLRTHSNPHFWFRAKPRQSWRVLQRTEDFAGKWKAIAGTRRPRARQRFARCSSS